MNLATKMAVQQISPVIWEIPPTEKIGMRVPARIYATEKMLSEMDAGVFDQVTNVACLPGIQRYALCMPDGHWGYGFPIGGVAAMDLRQGVISPGGVGYDINCGMRLIRTDLTVADVQPRLNPLMTELFRKVPAGVGARGFVKLNAKELKQVMRKGARWSVEQGYGWQEDLARTEESGCLAGADPSCVSDHAIERGIHQLGTLGSGNHYLEVQVVHHDRIFDHAVAEALGIHGHGQIVIMVHCGSRGFGHQVATDYLKGFEKAMKRYGITIPDQQLACAPFQSSEGQDYFSAMNCAANTAFANRQIITHQIREVFSKVFEQSPESLGMHQVYDVAHNIAKVERYREGDLLVHRKGATRAFGPGHPSLPVVLREVGQPVLVGGSMGTSSYVLAGTTGNEEKGFSSACHGAGRAMSRRAALKKWSGRQISDALLAEGIIVRSRSPRGIAEEAPGAYKDVGAVVEATEHAGLARRIVRLRPLICVKG